LVLWLTVLISFGPVRMEQERAAAAEQQRQEEMVRQSARYAGECAALGRLAADFDRLGNGLARTRAENAFVAKGCHRDDY
jgi:hypothetical protein